VTEARNGRGPKIYTLLAQLPFSRSYLGKSKMSVFLGTHVPLIALILRLVSNATATNLSSVPLYRRLGKRQESLRSGVGVTIPARSDLSVSERPYTQR